MDDSSTPQPETPAGSPKSVTPGQHRAPANDIAASVEFATFYQAEMPKLVRFLILCGAREDDAADAAQRAFILLYDKWVTVRSPKAWLRTVAFRAFPKLVVGNEQELEDDCAPPERVPFPLVEHIEIKEEEQRVLSLIRALSPAPRKVFALHYDGFTTTETAEILQMKEATVRQNLARARVVLKELLRRN